MEKHFELSDRTFAKKFMKCDLSPSLFTHEAHIRLAWFHIQQYGLKQAEINVQKQLKRFVESLGAVSKYNTTLTLAAVKAVYHFMLRSKSNNFKDFITEFPQLKSNFKELMACHYGFDIYTSEQAKTEYQQPDLLPFD